MALARSSPAACSVGLDGTKISGVVLQERDEALATATDLLELLAELGERLLRACGVVLHDLLGLAELVDYEVGTSVVDDSLDLFSLVSRDDDEAVFLRVGAVVLRNRQSDDAAAGIPAALADDFEYAVSRATSLSVDPFDLAVGGAKGRLVLRNSLESRVHAAILCTTCPAFRELTQETLLERSSALPSTGDQPVRQGAWGRSGGGSQPRRCRRSRPIRPPRA